MSKRRLLHFPPFPPLYFNSSPTAPPLSSLNTAHTTPPSLPPFIRSSLSHYLPPLPSFLPPSPFFNSSLSHSLASLPPSPPFPFPSTNLPGKCLASSAHLFPMALCVDKIVLSSSSLHGFLLMSGFK